MLEVAVGALGTVVEAQISQTAGYGNGLGIIFSCFCGIKIWRLVRGRCAGGKKDPKNTPEGPKSRGAYLGQKWELGQTGWVYDGLQRPGILLKAFF